MERKKLIIERTMIRRRNAIAMALMDETLRILFFSVCSGNDCADRRFEHS